MPGVKYSLLKMFVKMHPSTEAMGIWRYRYTACSICGSIRCRGTTKLMREQNRWNARHPANEHRRVLGAEHLRIRLSNNFKKF
jgi:hypothetical protein